MNKRLGCCIAILLVTLAVCLNFVSATTLTLTESNQTFGFQSGSYLGFRDDVIFDVHYQEASSNVTFPSYLFLQEHGTSELCGFYLGSGVNVTVNNFFDSSLLELDCTGVGTVNVYTPSRDAPTSFSGASLATFNTANKIVTITLSSSAIVQLNYGIIDGGGGGGGGTEPTPSPTTSATTVPYQTPEATAKPLGEVDFQANNIDLGTVKPNSTVKTELVFRFSGSSYKLQSIVFEQPFNSMYLHDESFNKLTYIVKTDGEGEGKVTLTFFIPSNIPVQRFTSGFQVVALDAAGGEHKSNGQATLLVEGATEEWGFMTFLREHPLYMIPIALFIILILGFIVLYFRKR
ncbi:MAG: hypothetical protein PHH61_06435 [Candidatus Nanoarchaeia archaeon]|nr:hypothetical protein [Candidatus Nanoarchaeia archaeon]